MKLGFELKVGEIFNLRAVEEMFEHPGRICFQVGKYF